jgi:hypothetical protein
MRISQVIAHLEKIKTEMGDVELLMAPTVIQTLGILNMPVRINKLEAWKVNEGYALIIPQYPK